MPSRPARSTDARVMVPALLIALAGSSAAFGALPCGSLLNLSSLDGATGFVINGIDTDDQSGFSVSSAGDINGDGISDLLIGATYADPNGHDRAGECYVVYGGGGIGAGGSFSLASVDGSNGFVMNGGAKLDRTGRSIDAADVNGDGVVDVIVGAATAAVNGIDGAGKVYVVYGRVTTDAGPFSAEVELTGLNGVDGFALLGTDWTDAAGFSVSSAGDVNGDGLVDVIIGAKRGDPNGLTDAGESYIVFGRAPTPACAGDINSDGSTNAADFTILAGIFGSSVTPNTGGDLNGDGIVNAADFTILAADFGCGN